MRNIFINLDTGYIVSDAVAATLPNVELRSVTNDEFEALLLACIPLNDRIVYAVAKTYHDVDTLYSVAVGNRAEEYRQAEAAALAYQAAGYAGAVSEYVSAWAAANPPMTNAQAADVIIARASTLRSAMMSARSQRFASQAAMRAANTAVELDAAVAVWDAFVATTKAALA